MWRKAAEHRRGAGGKTSQFARDVRFDLAVTGNGEHADFGHDS